jgi:hypothetical protein
MAAVSEQLWVRSTIRALEVEPAPQSLRASILLGLDEVDRDAAREVGGQPEAEPSLWTRIGTRARALMRGGLIMVPAGAVAGLMFFTVRGGFEEAAVLPGAGLASAINGSELAAPKAPAQKAERDVTRTLAEIEPQVGFPVQVIGKDATAQIELVGARVDPADGAASPTAHLRYRLLEKGRDTGRHIVDRQRPAGGTGPGGTPVTFRGRKYLLGVADGGEPVVHFQRGGVAHMVSLEGPGAAKPAAQDDPDFSHLLDVADHIAQGSR